MKVVAIVILVLACVFLLKLLKRNFGRALVVGVVLLGVVAIGLFASRHRISHPQSVSSSMIAMSINDGQHIITFDDMDYLRKKGATEKDVAGFVRSLSRDGKVEIVKYHDPLREIPLERDDRHHRDSIRSVASEVVLEVSSSADEIGKAIDELKAEVAELSEEFYDEVQAEFSSEEEYTEELAEEQHASTDERVEGDTEDRETEVTENDGEIITAGHDNQPPEWTFALDDWNGKTYRTMVTFATETDVQIEDKLLAEGFDRAQTNFGKWYREREGLYSEWYGQFPYDVKHRSDKKKCLQDYYTTTKDFPTGEGHEMVVVTQALYEFDAQQQRNIQAHYDSVRSLARTGMAGVGFAGLLGVLATCFGYLKLGHKASTCRRRYILRLAALGGLVGVATCVFVVAQALPGA